MRQETLGERGAEPIEGAVRTEEVQAEALPGDDAERLRISPGASPARGASEPLVVVVMFSDFECPFCARVEPTLARLLEAFPEEVRIVWRNNPLAFHRAAMPAAEAAMEAYAQGGDEAFWRYAARLFENQDALARTDLERYAAEVGLDVAALGRALDEHTHQDRIRADQREAERVGLRGTPSFLINGRTFLGAQPYEQFEAVVREEIAIAERLMERGTPRGALYASFMRGALEAPTPRREAPARARPEDDPTVVYRVPVDGRPTLGPADALVTVVMFSEFQCPFCQRVQPTLAEIADRYGADVRFVFRHNPLPFHPNAAPAAQAAEEVFAQRGAEAFFRYHDLLFQNQQDLERETLITLAARVGANPRDVERALDTNRHRAVIEADQGLARSLGANGTPSFFINGRLVRGAQPFPSFVRVIDAELARARERVQAGTPRAGVYAATIANGVTTAPPRPSAEAPDRPAPDHVYPLEVPRSAPSRGPQDAPVTIQVFSDFQCPFCQRVLPTIERLLQDYPREVRLVFRDYPLPFHQEAMPAAEAAREVFRQGGNEAFWRYHDLLFENQRTLDTDTLVRLAGEVPGVRAARVRRALTRGTHRAAVEADIRAITDAGARIGTPSFFIDGRLLQGAQPYEAFRDAVQRALDTP